MIWQLNVAIISDIQTHADWLYKECSLNKKKTIVNMFRNTKRYCKYIEKNLKK